MTADRDVLREVVLSAPPECPFHVFENGLVQDVLDLERRLAEGGGVTVSPRSVPHVVAEGRAHYRVAVTRAMNERLERLRQED